MYLKNIISKVKISDVFKKYKRFYNNSCIIINDEVREALNFNKPVVALESTIITHGMPYPDNLNCCLEVENIIRNVGSIPATIAILNGKIKVGLESQELTYLADIKKSLPIKVSRRDLPYVLSQKLNGGTTVSGTILIAKRIGIPIFATGGIGGVHRNVEDSFDISADLIELSKSNVAVISSGIKSILDIPKTLEYLETHGVFIATFNNDNEFPSFYCRKSGYKVPYSISTYKEAANIIQTSIDFNLESGLLFAIPIPENDSLDNKLMDKIIEKALIDAKTFKIVGKDITPFLLKRIADITNGKSLTANKVLIKNNARVAAHIAVELSGLKENKINKNPQKITKSNEKAPVIIGGSVLDWTIKLEQSNINMDGRMHYAKFSIGAGGVGRNICEALDKLGIQSNFLTIIGDDEQGKLLKSFIPYKTENFIKIQPNSNTSQFNLILNSMGDCLLLLGDRTIHQKISKQMILNHENIIKCSPLLILDGNLSIEALEAALEISTKYNIPVFYEPTDVTEAVKPFKTNYWKSIKYISPNLIELKEIASYFKIAPSINKQQFNKLEEGALIAKKLTTYIDNIIVTLGNEGVIIARKGEANEPFQSNQKPVQIRHYPAKNINDIVNVVGAGDNLAAGIITGILNNLNEEICLSIGFEAAYCALKSHTAVPINLFDKNHLCWQQKSLYNNIILNEFY